MGSHDKLFKAVFSQPANAAAHFQTFLPAEIAAELDLAEALHVPGSFVDEELKERHTDLLYNVPWRRDSNGKRSDALLFVIFEHQSTVDPLMPFRMLAYAVRVWEHWLREHTEQRVLPPLLPLVLYHGEQQWTAATELSELFSVGDVAPAALHALRPYLPNLKILVNEIASIPDEKMTGQGVVRLTLLLFKHIRRRDLIRRLPRWEDDFRIEVSRGNPGLRNLGLLVEYLLKRNKHVTVDALVEFLAPMGNKAKEIPMTEGERLIEQGRQEGLQKGRQEGRREGRQEGRREALMTTARKLLARGMKPADVAEATDLPLEEVTKLSH